MMIAKLSRLLPLVALVAMPGLAAADPPADSSISGLPEDKQVSELTTVEQEQLCEAAAAYTSREITEDDVNRALCSFEGIMVSLMESDGSVDACNAARDECLASPEGLVEPEDEQGESCQPGDWSTCKTTVGELDACIEEIVTDLKTFYEVFDCGNIEQFTGDVPPQEPERGEACSRVQSECPGFFPGDSLSELKPPRVP
ncbi:hypothetical protein [Nannocystis punicea]|uniref:Secreted protein n=1 Tax=Nannocystis punicea TaxID=2995304 RepID=A0ABY7GX22_9BACT|nr:hypothetical protein [Nannocystis poenicansa]WAS91472.1 hypothetical protein O0S08_35260 [Nannocystis poenicansa]